MLSAFLATPQILSDAGQTYSLGVSKTQVTPIAQDASDLAGFVVAVYVPAAPASRSVRLAQLAFAVMAAKCCNSFVDVDALNSPVAVPNGQ